MLRRARDRDGTTISPTTIDGMRNMGVRSLEAICEAPKCGHGAILGAAACPTIWPYPERLRCSRCGGEAVSTRLNWLEHQASGRVGR